MTELTTTPETGATLVDVDVESIIDQINGSTEAVVDESTAAEEITAVAEAPLTDAVSADVDAILAEITDAGPAAGTEKPKRTRKAKNSSEATPPSPTDEATEAAPTTASVATNPGAFLALTKLDATVYQDRFDAAAKKVKEKAANAVAAIDNGKKLSRFTSLAVKSLVDKGTVTSADLIQTYRDAGLGDGTARAQGQQMTALFRMFDLVEQDGKNFKLANEELGKHLVSVAA